MKKILYKTMIIVLCLFMMPFMSSAVFAEEESGVFETERRSDEYPSETIRSAFYVLTVKEDRSLEVPFDRDWFKEDARNYSNDLAKASLGLATAAFRPKIGKDGIDTPTDINLSEFLKEAHFEDLRSDDYDKNPSIYTVSTVMGHQRIGQGADSFELIAVGVCGQGYLDEWESNFSIGTGEVHEGFDRSAGLVYDRIFGYIASHDLKGPLKIWMSGFSRAAAVSNITAARLSESPVFSQESVFAYTFATPRTVRDEDAGRYQNIFNIVGKTDPVPNVPFADWGFRRYGRSLYLPAPETDSDYYEKRKKANEVYKKLTGIDYWYNLESDYALKTILAYCLELSPTVEVYAATLQDKLIGMWADRSPVNITKNLLELANDPVLINDENRYQANHLLDYISGFAMAYINDSSIFRSWNPTASLGANMLQAHTPELYVSWVFSIQDDEDFFDADNDYSELYISSTDTVSLIRDGKVIETFEALYGPDATQQEIARAERQAKTPEGNVYLRYVEYSLMCVLPRDSEYSIRVPASNGDNYFSVLQLDYNVESQVPTKTIWYDYTIDEGDAMTVVLDPDGETRFVTDKPLVKEKLNFKDDLQFDVSLIVSMTRTKNLFSLPWRTAAIGMISVTMFIFTLLLFLLTYLVSKTRYSRQKKKGRLPKDSTYSVLPIASAYTVFFVFIIKEFFNALHPEDKGPTLLFKLAVAAVALLSAHVGYHRRKQKLFRRLFNALIILTFADVIMTLDMLLGGILHIAAYIYLTCSYWSEEKPDRKQIIAWAILSLLGIVAVMLVEGHFGVMRFLAVAYLVVASAMVCSCFSLPRNVFTGSLLLFVGGILLMNNEVKGTTFLSHILSLGTYYAAVLVLACSGIRMSRHRKGEEAAS
ncbi:MAG: hypothetical protein IIZ28_06820 [Erysipelotrichaceae bacterium]|nr:hypothetical protein [Erysipelotrichaceae bacterium]